MNHRTALRILCVTAACCIILSCNLLQPAGPGAGPSTSSPTQPAAGPTSTSASPGTALPAITSVDWDASSHIIQVGVDAWPAEWSPWTMYVDGKEVAIGEADGAVDVRPNGPLSARPNGVIVGTLPWVSSLEAADVPCCGSLQFSVPGVGMTKAYDYNLRDAGCATASAKVCPAEWTVHDGDWIIQGTEIIEDQKVIQRGNIYVRGGATLTLKNAELRIERGKTPTVHVYIFVDPGGKLIIDGSKVYPGPVDGGLTCVWNAGNTVMSNSPTSIHYFQMLKGATFTMDNSAMVFEIGGLLQAEGGKTHVTNSTLGALALGVPAGAHLNASGLKFGMHFDNWKVQDMIPEADYELTLDNVTTLEDFTGEFAHGPYERGWIFFLDQNSHVRLSDSAVRKIFIDLRGGTSEFQNLRIGEPASLTYRDIILQNVTATGQWGFTLNDANTTFRNSTYLFLQPSGASNLKLIDSHMVEFIPRDFTGTITFENSEWNTAGEIIGKVGYHSGSNNFKMAGSLRLGADLRQSLQWKDAKVTREFEVYLTDSQGNPISGGLIKVGGKEYPTDASGRALFSIVFDENNYMAPTTLEAWQGGSSVASRQVDFFTESPIQLSR